MCCNWLLALARPLLPFRVFPSRIHSLLWSLACNPGFAFDPMFCPQNISISFFSLIHFSCLPHSFSQRRPPPTCCFNIRHYCCTGKPETAKKILRDAIKCVVQRFPSLTSYEHTTKTRCHPFLLKSQANILFLRALILFLSSNFRFGHSLGDKVGIFVSHRSPDDYYSFIHSFNFTVFFACARLVLCLISVGFKCVCVFEIRLSIELMDVMTSSAVMLLYVNIVAQCKRIDKMWNMTGMRWERRRRRQRPYQRRRADEKVLAANRSKEIIRIRRRSQWQRRPHS